MSELSKRAQSVQEALKNKGVEFKVMELAASTRTAQEAADALGCTVAQIVKSLLFRISTTGEPLLLLVSGQHRVDEKKVAELIGEPIEKADADFTRESTGFAIGGIPPIGHKRSLQTFIDQTLLDFDVIWAAAGTPHAVFQLRPQDLMPLTGGEVLALARG